jgi:hypothetical protein
MNLSRDSDARHHIETGLAEIKTALTALPSELRGDIKHLGNTVGDISKDAFAALQDFFKFQESKRRQEEGSDG